MKKGNGKRGKMDECLMDNIARIHLMDKKPFTWMKVGK
jgi:hypothetical protein